MKKKTTTIKISQDLVEEFKKLKIHPRQSYDEVIRRIFEEWKKMKKST